MTALYWHLVDIIWIMLYPLLYLGGRVVTRAGGASKRRSGGLARALLAAWWSNLAVWAALLVLLVGLARLAYMPLGAWNFPVGVGIALIKAALVGLCLHGAAPCRRR